MNATRIEHVDCTWNVVTGCWHGCPYCYARKAAEEGPYLRGRHGYPSDHPFEPTFHPNRLGEPLAVKRPRLIFPSSMGDIMGDWVPAEWISRTIAVCAEADWHRFLFLTKNPERYLEFTWPENCWLGTSVTGEDTAENRDRLDALSRVEIEVNLRTFVSVEPFTLCDGEIAYLGDGHPSWVIGGAQTKPDVLPSCNALDLLCAQVRCYDAALFIKDSLADVWKLVSGVRPAPREWPEALRLKYGKSARAPQGQPKA